MVDLQSYLNKFTGNAAGSTASSKEKVQTGDSNIDPINVIHATILGVCHFQSCEGTNIKTNITESSRILEMNLSPSELNVIVVDEFSQCLI